MVADSQLVHVSETHVTCSSNSVEHRGERSVPAAVSDSTSGCRSPQPSRMAFVRQKLRGSGLSETAIDLNLKGIRKSTRSVYDNHWKQWSLWCSKNKVDKANPSPVDIANHLAYMSNSLHLSAASLRVRRSTISSTLAAIDRPTFVSNKIAANVIKATALQQSKIKNKIPAWDILVLLSFLMSERFEPLEAASFKNLTFKTCFLVMLASGRRASEVCNLSGLPEDVSFEKDGSVSLHFLPEFLAKNQNPENPSPTIVIPPLTRMVDFFEPDYKNCPVRALKIYRKRSSNVRDPHQRALFLSHNPRYEKDIRVTTFSRWLRELIVDAYLFWAEKGEGEHSQGVLALSKPRPHEIRAWASSLAIKSTPIKQVLEAAFWSSEDVFVNFYLRDIARKRENGSWGLPALVVAQTTIPASNSH